MSADAALVARETYYKAVGRVLWRVLLANLTVSVAKIVLGLVSGALAVVADGFHSLVDTSSNLIGLAAVRLASRPADREHPYGYRRYESIGALAIGVLLLAAAWEIGTVIFERIFIGSRLVVTPLLVGMVALTLPINLLVVILEVRAGRRLKSEILLADAAHTRTDLYVTLSVLISLVGVSQGWVWLDQLVAGLVVLLILRAAFRILRDSAGWLADAMVADPEQIEKIAERVSGVLYVHRVRSRGSPDAGYVDLHVKVHPGMSTEQAHAIATEVENRLKSELPNVVDALVHIEPGRPEEVGSWNRIAYELRQIADGMGLGLHDLHVHADATGEYAIELHLEMEGNVSLAEAHALAEQFEARVQIQMPRAGSVITHLEPVSERVLARAYQADARLEGKIRAALARHVGAENILELRTHQLGEKVSVAVRVCLPARYSLSEAHNRAEEIERDLILRFPDLHRVVVHSEPSRS